ncbi:sulfite exporter TauE/SafE family protein [soil metagenome]
MEIIGYICATLIGISLGILGSGGSILTVPIMVYLMNINPVDATGLSLFVVGITSATGGITYWRKKLVDMKTAVIFATPSILSVFLTRKYLMPLIPDPVFSSSSFNLSKEIFILILFSLLMVVVGYNMIRKAKFKEAEAEEFHSYNYPGLIAIGLVSGILTGILGVGGGFIIIPALVLFAKIPVRMSVGTSLLIIAVNSLGGFTQEVLSRNALIDYNFLFLFALFSVAGIFIGLRISLKLQPANLKKLFGWFIILMGVSIFIKEIFFRV